MTNDRRHVSTGSLPPIQKVQELINTAHGRFGSANVGKVADHVPSCAGASPDWFGICVVGVRGGVAGKGDHARPLPIQSIAKPFVFALVCEALGPERARSALGVNNTGLPNHSLMALELNGSRPMNPIVNAGALTTTSLVPGADADERWGHVRKGLSRFAGRDLEMDDDVYASETAANRRDQGIAHLLKGYGHLHTEADEAVDRYSKQSSLIVTTIDLAVMGATLASGGVNPLTGERVVGSATCQRVLAVLATAGHHQHSGDWLYECGLPGTSSPLGATVTVAPGKGGLAVYSPPLDTAGNSVRGRLATKHLSEVLGLNVFASAPVPAPSLRSHRTETNGRQPPVRRPWVH